MRHQNGNVNRAVARDDEFVKQFVNGKIYWFDGSVACSHISVSIKIVY